MESVVLKVRGMKCEGCVSSVKEALESTPGVTKADVDLDSGTATVEYDAELVSPEDLLQLQVFQGVFRAEL